MNLENIRKGLQRHDTNKVGVYINYLKFLEEDKDKDGRAKNPWIKQIQDQPLIDVYNKVAMDGVFIDGETITLGWRGALQVTYNFQAYKNLVMIAYPESMFDLQLVHEGDDFSFHKDSGKVIYTHHIRDPFKIDKTIIGAYCIIKNKRGEFLETINMDEVKKMKEVARTKTIWDNWQGEMILKSVVKRACKRHFNDIIANADLMDNENYDLERAGFDNLIQKKIEECGTQAELTTLYNQEKDNVTDKNTFLKLLAERKNEILVALPALTDEMMPRAIEMSKGKRDLTIVKQIWKITEDQEIHIKTQAGI